VSAQSIRDYATGGTATPDERIWTLEAHLESCPVCRQRLADTVSAPPGRLTGLLDTVWLNLQPELSASTPAPARSSLVRSARTWASPVMVPWLATTSLVVLMALGFDLAARAAHSPLPSVALLLAPVAPLLGVAAAWSGGIDPVHEVVSATPRSGLYLVLRRTVAVLAVVLPLLAVVGWVIGSSLALWLVPCLVFTLAALALGSRLGVPRAAAGLGAAWAVFVVVPSLVTTSIPVVLRPASLLGWAAVGILAVAVLLLRADSYTHLGSQR
jgi:hypothetical protein